MRWSEPVPIPSRPGRGSQWGFDDDGNRVAHRTVLMTPEQQAGADALVLKLTEHVGSSSPKSVPEPPDA